MLKLKTLLLTAALVLLGTATATARPHLFGHRRACQPTATQAPPTYQPAPAVVMPQVSQVSLPPRYQPGPVAQAVGHAVYSVAQVPAAVGQRVSQCVGGVCPIRQ